MFLKINQHIFYRISSAVIYFTAFVLFAIGCNDAQRRETDKTPDRTAVPNNEPVPATVDTIVAKKDSITSDTTSYGNHRFRKVRAEQTGDLRWRVTGEGQIFEAIFNWRVEDGKKTILEGTASSSPGAPSWGKFDFNVVLKKKPASSVKLIVFEYSMADGSVVNEVYVPLVEKGK